MTDRTYAAIDLGSNSCRLFICDEKGQPLLAEHYTTQLAAGMRECGSLTDEALDRGRAAFKTIRKLLDEYKVVPQNLRAIATAACRTAKNGQSFVDEIRDDFGIDLEIINGREEAELNLQGAAINARGLSKYLLLWDIGGGSTEITLAENSAIPHIIHTISIPYGARNGAEEFGLAEYDEKKADNLRKVIRRYLQDFVVEVAMPEVQDLCFVATSSTALRLAAMIEGKKQYKREDEDGHIIKCNEVKNVLAQIYGASIAEMAKNPCIGESRAPIFVTAAIIFEEIIAKLYADNIIVSLKCAKDAIIQNLIERDKNNG